MVIFCLHIITYPDLKHSVKQSQPMRLRGHIALRKINTCGSLSFFSQISHLTSTTSQGEPSSSWVPVHAAHTHTLRSSLMGSQSCVQPPKRSLVRNERDATAASLGHPAGLPSAILHYPTDNAFLLMPDALTGPGPETSCSGLQGQGSSHAQPAFLMAQPLCQGDWIKKTSQGWLCGHHFTPWTPGVQALSLGHQPRLTLFSKKLYFKRFHPLPLHKTSASAIITHTGSSLSWPEENLGTLTLTGWWVPDVNRLISCQWSASHIRGLNKWQPNKITRNVGFTKSQKKIAANCQLLHHLEKYLRILPNIKYFFPTT